MTITEVRQSKEYTKCVNKIKKYKKGFQFTLYAERIPRPQWNALMIVLDDCIKDGLLESVSFGFDLDMNVTEKTYKRI